MLNQPSVDFGVEYKVCVLDRETRAVKHETDWGHNVILNNTGLLFSKGFDQSPQPMLGSNGSVPTVTNTGVINPIPEMRLVATKHDPSKTTWDSVVPNNAIITWFYEHEYMNLSTGTVTLREIGIDGFSRALLKTSDGLNASIPVTQYDVVAVGVRFIMNVNMAKQSASIVDIVDSPIDTFDIDYILSPPTDIKTAKWWKLLKLADTITLVTDSGDKVISEFAVETKPTTRGIGYKYTIIADDTINWTGVKYRFASNVPLIEAKFSKPIAVPASQKFELTLNPKW